MVQCWAHKPEDRPTFVALRDFLLEVRTGLPRGAQEFKQGSVLGWAVTYFCPQAQPTDMRALQDFEEPDKLHIQMNDVITVIEGR